MKKITNKVLFSTALVVVFCSCGLFAPSEKNYLELYSEARDYMLQNRPEKAIPLYRKAIGLKEDFAQAYHEMAVCLQQIGENDSAIVYYMGAISYNPRNVDAYQSIGNIYYMLGNYDDALVWYDRATEVDELYPRSYQNMGTIWLFRENYELAGKYFEMAVTVDATYPRAYYGLGIVAWKLGDAAGAESRFLEAVSIDSMPEAIYMLGQLHFENGSLEEASVWLERYLQKEPQGEWAEKAKELLVMLAENQKARE